MSDPKKPLSEGERMMQDCEQKFSHAPPPPGTFYMPLPGRAFGKPSGHGKAGGRGRTARGSKKRCSGT